MNNHKQEVLSVRHSASKGGTGETPLTMNMLTRPRTKRNEHETTENSGTKCDMMMVATLRRQEESGQYQPGPMLRIVLDSQALEKAENGETVRRAQGREVPAQIQAKRPGQLGRTCRVMLAFWTHSSKKRRTWRGPLTSLRKRTMSTKRTTKRLAIE